MLWLARAVHAATKLKFEDFHKTAGESESRCRMRLGLRETDKRHPWSLVQLTHHPSQVVVITSFHVQTHVYP